MLLKSVLLLLSLVSAINGLEWIDEDAVYIEDKTTQKPPLTRDDHQTSSNTSSNHNDTISLPSVTAIPVEIIPGQCVKASECYPILFYSPNLSQDDENDGEVHAVDQVLIKYILSTANYCEPSDLPAQALELEKGRSDHPSDDVYIWCPIRTFPTSKPSIILTSNNSTEESSTEPTTENNNIEVECGPVKTTEHEEDTDFPKVRVVGGKEASFGEFPYMVALTNKGKQFCSASLIDSRHVLLAAHCVSHLRRQDLKNLKAYIGDHNIKDPADVIHQERNVTAVIFHSNFTMHTVHHDIGMLYLSEPVIFNENVAPICLSSQEVVPFDDGSRYGMLAGWGQAGVNKSASPILMKTQLRIWRHEECFKKYEGKIPGNISKKMFCAGTTAPIVRDSCKGNSGAPLSLISNNRVQQVGIVSFGIGCGVYPGVYTRVDKYMNWIEKHRMRSSKYFGN